GAGERGYDDDGSPDALAALRPLNLYGWTKHLFDRRVARAVKDRESTPPQWAGLKFFNVYGPNEYHKGTMQSVVARNYRAVASGGEVALFKSYRTDVPDGEQRRDFIFVDDCVHVILWLLDNPTVNGLFNVGTGHAASFTELMQSLFAACGRPPQIKFCDMPDETRDHYQYFTEAKIDRLRAAGFTQPLTSVEQGVRRYVEHFLAKPDSYR
ncbi:MAG: NAD-dependent epimerase/dehydratase family protein, partial [Gemmatimonadaceae bacterium]